MKEIIEKLKTIMDKIEALDDPTAPEAYRDKVGDAVYFIEECISTMEEIRDAQ